MSYTLNIQKCLSKVSGEYKALIVSDILDQRLTPNGQVISEINACKDKSVVILDDFILRSIDFLVSESSVVAAKLQDVLHESFVSVNQEQGCGYKEFKDVQDIWKLTKLSRCIFRNRIILNYDRIKREIKEQNSWVDSMLAAGSGYYPDGRPKYVKISAKDYSGDQLSDTIWFKLIYDVEWDDEHQVFVEYKNGVCLSSGQY